MQGILEQLIHEVKQAGLPVKLTIEIGCACKDKPTEEPPSGILTEDSEIIQTEANENLTQEIN